MKQKPKVIVIMPAHNAANTLESSYKRLPKQYIDEVILIDDASQDNTFEIAKKLNLTTFRNKINLGYGGNLKICLTKALERNADIIIEFHPDNQYDPKNLPLFLKKATEGYDFALGSRFIHPKEALDRHMPLIKFIANRLLTFIDQFILGIELSEFHSGFRMYTRNLLENVPYLQNSDDYLFSFEIIVQAVFFRFKISEVQISCDYHPTMHTANLRKSTIYALGTFKTLLQYIKSRFRNNPTGPFKKATGKKCPLCNRMITRIDYEVIDAVSNEKFTIYYCTPCNLGFTHPQPRNATRYYPRTYYSGIKTKIYNHLQYRRLKFLNTITNTGSVLDIGCGEGGIGYKLVKQGFQYQGIEASFSNVKNESIKLVGIEGMKEKPYSYDIVTFWESFEHLKDPVLSVKKAYRALKSNGYIVIECPRYDAWEKLLFGSRWFHLDPPRHYFHYTRNGLEQVLKDFNFQPIVIKSIYAPEYIPVGFAQSLLYKLSPRFNIFARSFENKRNIFLPISLLFLAIIAAPLTYIFYLLGGSPIQLLVAQKR